MDEDVSAGQVPEAFPLKKNVRAWVSGHQESARPKAYHLAQGTLVRPVRSPAETPSRLCEVRVMVSGRERSVYVDARDFLPEDYRLIALEALQRDLSRQAIEFTRPWRGVEPKSRSDQS